MKLKNYKGGMKEMNKENHAIAITGIVSGVILIVALAFLFSGSGLDTNPTQDFISVQGVGEIEVMPDLVSIYFNIETKADTSVEAKDKNSEILDEFIDSLILIGLEREDIVTQSFNVYQDYSWDNGVRKDNGFIATHTIKVEVLSNDTDKLGKIIDSGIDSGAYINYINFELSQSLQSEYKALAMRIAADDAKIKAESVAEGFDMKIGKLVSVQVDNYDYYPWNIYTASGYAKDTLEVRQVTSNIQPGKQKVTATVSAKYKFK